MSHVGYSSNKPTIQASSPMLGLILSSCHSQFLVSPPDTVKQVLDLAISLIDLSPDISYVQVAFACSYESLVKLDGGLCSQNA